MNKMAFVLLASLSLANPSNILNKWAEYRLIEMFTLSTQNKDDQLPNYFSDQAWLDYQQSLESSNIINFVNERFNVAIKKFIKPVVITNNGQNGYFAQSTFLLNFSNEHSSWTQPVEIILTLHKENNQMQITGFEGITAKPMNVRNYILDHAKECNA